MADPGTAAAPILGVLPWTTGRMSLLVANSSGEVFVAATSSKEAEGSEVARTAGAQRSEGTGWRQAREASKGGCDQRRNITSAWEQEHRNRILVLGGWLRAGPRPQGGEHTSTAHSRCPTTAQPAGARGFAARMAPGATLTARSANSRCGLRAGGAPQRRRGATSSMACSSAAPSRWLRSGLQPCSGSGRLALSLKGCRWGRKTAEGGRRGWAQPVQQECSLSGRLQQPCTCRKRDGAAEHRAVQSWLLAPGLSMAGLQSRHCGTRCTEPRTCRSRYQEKAGPPAPRPNRTCSSVTARQP